MLLAQFFCQNQQCFYTWLLGFMPAVFNPFSAQVNCMTN